MTSNEWMRAIALASGVWTLSACGSGASSDNAGGGGEGSALATGGAAGATTGGAAGVATGGASGSGGSAVATGDASWDAGPCPRFVTSSPFHAFGPGQDVGQAAFPAPTLGPPKGAGTEQGSLDVVSLGNGGVVSVEFGGTLIVDEPGPDFIVFENAFWAGGDSTQPFAELGTVEVSNDGKTWVGFPCDALSAPYGSCAGWHPVFANADENSVDPLDPAVAGGDAFDLADVGLSQARFVRITDRADLTGVAGVFDLDAVGVVHAQCP